MNNVIYYRLSLNLSRLTTSAIAPSSGRYTLEVKTLADDRVFTYINSVMYNSAQTSIISTKQFVNDGKQLIAFSVINYSGAGAFAAGLLLNGQPIAATGDKSNWKVSYGDGSQNAPAGWNNNLAFDDSSWSNFTGSCVVQTSYFATAAPGLQVNGSQPQVLWGPSKTTD